MQDIISSYQDELGGLFKELMLGAATHQIGISHMVEHQAGEVSLNLSGGSESEPMHVSELVSKREMVRLGIIEHFQIKAIAMWHDLLNDIYSGSIARHFSSGADVSALGKVRFEVDFSCGSSFEDQLIESSVKDFAFMDYKKRISCIGRLIPLDDVRAQLSVISKHVEIRNSYQHHSGYMHKRGLSNLGVSKISVKDEFDRSVEVAEGDKLILSVIEADILKSALFRVSSKIGVYFETNQA